MPEPEQSPRIGIVTAEPLVAMKKKPDDCAGDNAAQETDPSDLKMQTAQLMVLHASMLMPSFSILLIDKSRDNIECIDDAPEPSERQPGRLGSLKEDRLRLIVR